MLNFLYGVYIKLRQIDKAISLASEAHFGQIDKAGQPYILHPLRLMFNFSLESEMIVAILHDVIEDSHFTLNDLKQQGFADEIINAVECLSKKQGENYEDFITRLSSNKLAKKIKIVDIKDNMNLSRLDQVNESDLFRVKKYHKALKLLLSVNQV